MSGFKSDVISILRDNVLLHGEAMGWIVGSTELYEELTKKKFPVTEKADKLVFLFDYVVISAAKRTFDSLLKALTSLSNLGVIVVEITDVQDRYDKEYRSYFGGFAARKLKYQDRAYLVIRQGLDYGN